MSKVPSELRSLFAGTALTHPRRVDGQAERNALTTRIHVESRLR